MYRSEDSQNFTNEITKKAQELSYASHYNRDILSNLMNDLNSMIDEFIKPFYQSDNYKALVDTVKKDSSYMIKNLFVPNYRFYESLISQSENEILEILGINKKVINKDILPSQERGNKPAISTKRLSFSSQNEYQPRLGAILSILNDSGIDFTESIINEYPKIKGRDLYYVLSIPSIQKRIVFSNYKGNATFVIDESCYANDANFSLADYNRPDLSKKEGVIRIEYERRWASELLEACNLPLHKNHITQHYVGLLDKKLQYYILPDTSQYNQNEPDITTFTLRDAIGRSDVIYRKWAEHYNSTFPIILLPLSRSVFLLEFIIGGKEGGKELDNDIENQSSFTTMSINGDLGLMILDRFIQNGQERRINRDELKQIRLDNKLSWNRSISDFMNLLDNKIIFCGKDSNSKQYRLQDALDSAPQYYAFVSKLKKGEIQLDEKNSSPNMPMLYYENLSDLFYDSYKAQISLFFEQGISYSGVPLQNHLGNANFGWLVRQEFRKKNAEINIDTLQLLNQLDFEYLYKYKKILLADMVSSIIDKEYSYDYLSRDQGMSKRIDNDLFINIISSADHYKCFIQQYNQDRNDNDPFLPNTLDSFFKIFISSDDQVKTRKKTLLPHIIQKYIDKNKGKIPQNKELLVTTDMEDLIG